MLTIAAPIRRPTSIPTQNGLGRSSASGASGKLDGGGNSEPIGIVPRGAGGAPAGVPGRIGTLSGEVLAGAWTAPEGDGGAWSGGRSL